MIEGVDQTTYIIQEPLFIMKYPVDYRLEIAYIFINLHHQNTTLH